MSSAASSFIAPHGGDLSDTDTRRSSAPFVVQYVSPHSSHAVQTPSHTAGVGFAPASFVAPIVTAGSSLATTSAGDTSSFSSAAADTSFRSSVSSASASHGKTSHGSQQQFLFAGNSETGLPISSATTLQDPDRPLQRVGKKSERFLMKLVA